MLADRVRITLILLPVVLAAIFAGGIIFALAVCLVLGMAAWEYLHIFRTGGYQPSLVLVVGGILLLVLTRHFTAFEFAAPLISALILLALAYHTIQFERGQDSAALDFPITLAGLLYLGWIGAYFVSLRALPDGLWWTFVVLPSVWLSDTLAYFIGKTWGRHLLSPRLSPKKTWEGYAGSVLGGLLGGLFFAWLVGFWASPALTVPLGALIGLLLGLLVTLGDLGESLFKRRFNIKDSGQALGGHGGMFDRIDSWLWAAVIGYYLVIWLV